MTAASTASTVAARGSTVAVECATSSAIPAVGTICTVLAICADPISCGRGAFTTAATYGIAGPAIAIST